MIHMYSLFNKLQKVGICSNTVMLGLLNVRMLFLYLSDRNTYQIFPYIFEIMNKNICP